MKIRILSLILALLVLTACGAETTSAAPETPQEEVPQTFGQVTEDTAPVQMAETTAMPSPQEAAPEEELQGAPLAPAEADEGNNEWEPLHAQITALILIKESDALSYQAEDPVAMLRSLGYLVGLMRDHDSRIKVSGAAGTITASLAEEYVKALFHDFSGQFPAVTEEDPLVKKNGNHYEINLVELGEFSLDCGPRVEEADGTMTVTAALTLDGRTLPAYRFTVESTDGEVFDYAISAIERAPAA